jgi:hypothetical protein
MIPIELFKPIFANIHDKGALVGLSTLSKSLQPTVESLLWTRLSLLRTFANNNPTQSTKKLRVIYERTGKYVRRVELSLGFIVQWILWERTEQRDTLDEIASRLLQILNSMIMTDRLRLSEMDDRSAPPEVASLITRLEFPNLKQVHYSGTFKPELQGFLDRHPKMQTLFIGTDGSSGAHELLAVHKFDHGRILLPHLTALEATVPILHTLLPLLDPGTPLRHVTISFGFHGSVSYLRSQINHILAQNAAFTNPETGCLEGLIFPSVRILRLDELIDEVFHEALQCFLPRFPNLQDIGNVVLSGASIPMLFPILPNDLRQIHLVYEGIMWDAEFIGLKRKLKEQCRKLTSVDLWAWSEAYHDLWGCRWGDQENDADLASDPCKIWNVKTYKRSVLGNPAVLWVRELHWIFLIFNY